MNILIIEDDPILSKNICAYMEMDQFVCFVAHDLKNARDKIYSAAYDCIILDISLPDGNGLQVLQELKSDNKEDGVLIISAKNSLDDRIKGLKLGADDYLIKPFHLAELSARVGAIIRRKAFAGFNTIVLDQLVINMSDRSVKCDKGFVDLTRKEYDLLIYFAINKNRVVTKESISDHLWGDSADMANTHDYLYSQIKNLRLKLAQMDCPEYIRTVYGVGYKFIIP